MSAALAIGFLVLSTGAVASAPASAPSPAAPSSAIDTRERPQFYADAIVNVSGDIDGDVYAAGQSVTVSGNVTGDVIAAAQTITITGTVDGNLRLSAQSVTINGKVTHSGTIFAADINIAETGTFGDDLVGAASTVAIAGEVGREVLLSVDRLTIDGSVGGDLSYVSDSKAHIADGAVDGSVERVEAPQSPTVEVSPWAAIVAWALGLLYALVAFNLVTLLAGLLFPRWLQQVTDHLVPSPLESTAGRVRRISRYPDRAADPISYRRRRATCVCGTTGVGCAHAVHVRVRVLLHWSATAARQSASCGQVAGRRPDPHRRTPDPVAEHLGVVRDGVHRPRRPATEISWRATLAVSL